MNRETSTLTLTFGDQAENHVGMEQLGEMVEEGQGFQYDDLEAMYQYAEDHGLHAELYHLHEHEPNGVELPPAYLFILRNPVEDLLGHSTADELWDEQVALPMDKKAFMYGRVVNKHARWNLCFDDESKNPDYEKGKGRVIGWDRVPLLRELVEQFPIVFGEKATRLKGEGNYYYDTKQCGIGYHGDSERRKVIALRLGASMTLYYQWYYRGEAVGPRLEIPLHHGDMYVMSEKAVGTDWKKKTIYTLRHATGAEKFIS